MGCASKAVVLAPPRAESNNLVLNVWGDNSNILRARVAAAAEAVSPYGKLILDYAPRTSLAETSVEGRGLPVPIRSLLSEVPSADQRLIYITESTEPYPWIRDSSFGWQAEENGNFRVNVKSDGNLATKDHPGSFSAASIVTLLNSCSDSALDLPRLRKIALQEGMIVSNGAGVCVTNALVPERVRDSKDPTLFKDIGCKKVISAIDWRDWRRQGHPNGHIDMSVAFLSPKVAVIPKLDPNCKTDFVTGWTNLRDRLNAAGINTIEIPIGLGCIYKDVVIRTYSNMVVLKDSILVSRFLSPDPDLEVRLEPYNDQAMQILKDAMDRDEIPRRKIIQFPIENEIKGGSVHCMSLNIPGPLGNCTQVRFDSVIHKKAGEGLALAKAASKTSREEFCQKASDLLQTMGFISKYMLDRTLQVSPVSEPIRLTASDRTQVDAMITALSPLKNKECP
jgi:hypothetical protein